MIIVEPNAPVVLNPGPTIFTLSHRYTYIWGLPRSHFHRLYGRGPEGLSLLRVCRRRALLVIHQQLLRRFRSRPARSCKCATAVTTGAHHDLMLRASGAESLRGVRAIMPFCARWAQYLWLFVLVAGFSLRVREVLCSIPGAALGQCAKPRSASGLSR